MKKWLSWFLCFFMAMGLFTMPAQAAPEWPSYVPVEAEGGIVMDADSGAILYGKNMDVTYYPASITKILTALIVLERCDDLDEMVTFSHDAVYKYVESNSTNAGMDAGDQMSVRDCLYAMMLKSANEVANALAEHTAGTVEEFADLMNEKAAELGCTNSHFANPSGLNNENHYTTARDMALIAQAAFQNEMFVEINSSLYYSLPPSKNNPDGQTVYPGHRMLKKNSANYYAGVIGGKTGYTSLAGNTLVTCAERDDMKLITVILNGHQTHYTDTKALLDFGYKNFKSLKISDYDTTFSSIENDMTIAGLPTTDLSLLKVEKDYTITLPKDAEFTDAAASIDYNLDASDPPNALAKIQYTYGDRNIGHSYLTLMDPSETAVAPIIETSVEPDLLVLSNEQPETDGNVIPETAAASTEGRGETAEANSDPTTAPEETEGEPKVSRFPSIPPTVWIVLAVIASLGLIIGGILLLKYRIEKKEEEERLRRYQRRQQRLKDIGISNTDFDLMMQKRRTSSSFSSRSGQGRKKESGTNHFNDQDS